MKAATITLPDPVTAADAAMWPELVTVPALVDLGTGTALFVECYHVTSDTGARMPIAHLRALTDDDGVAWQIGLDLTMLRGWIAALQAAERELLADATVIQ